ncbi:MAG: hypothetical protein EB059_08635 [Alphaproteobacteria bacterium]|nr:hypothetical protein [Alphaproteobacteria bacterium]
MARSFTIESVQQLNGKKINYTGGRFISDTPSASAKKVFTKVYHYINKKGPLNLKIKIRETTQGSLHKTYDYKVGLKAQKVEVEKDGTVITYNFITKIKSI